MTPTAAISVVICTRNPRRDYLDRVLWALADQSLPLNQWELLVIDNGSDEQLVGRINLAWHPAARHIREDKLGFSAVRARGILEAKGNILVFVDDDNVLASDYLSQGLALFSRRPDLGAVSGRIVPEYEVAPPAWLSGEYESWIAIRRITKDTSSNFMDSRSEPCSAGMLLRREIGLGWAQACEQTNCPMFLADDSNRPLSGEDVEIVKYAVDQGYTVGMFGCLTLTHLIPSNRVHPNALFAIYRNIIASATVREVVRSGAKSIAPTWRTVIKECWRFLKGNSIERRLVLERLAALRIARRTMSLWRP